MPLTPETWLDEFTVNATTANTQTGAKVIQLANGNILVVWESNDNSGVGSPDGYDIIGQLFDPLGNAIGSEFRLNTNATFDDERDAEIAALPNGGFVVVFEDQQNIGGPADGQDDIYAQYYDANGVSQAVIAVAFGSSTDTFLNPRIAASSNTSVLIVYDDIVSGDAGVKGKIWNPITNTLGSEISLLAGGDGNADDITVTALDNGNYVIVHSADSGTSNAIYYRIIDSAGNNVKGFTAVANTATDTRNDFDPSVAALSNGGFAISWTDNDGSDVDVRYQAFDSAGNEVGPKGTVTPNGTGNLNTASNVVGLADGGFLVFYDDAENSEIQVNRYDNAGAAVGSQYTIDTDGAFSAANVRATALEDGRVALVWNQGEIRMEILDTRDAANTPVYTPDNYQIGTIGNDTITATADLVYGHDGNDDISDGGGANTVFGGNGDDTIGFSGVASSEALHGEAGTDWLENESNSAVSVHLGNGTITSGSTVQTATGFEAYIGGSNSDTVTGSSDANTLQGNAGNDTLNGLDGNDQLNGATGNDSILGGANNDTLNGGEDNDILDGQGGADLVQGGIGNDTLRGGAGQDTINGGDGDDYVFQINQNLTEDLDGGLGNDTLDLSDGSTTSFTIDLLAGTGTAGASTVLVLAGFENVIGTSFNDTFTGDDGANLIRGLDGNDTLAGGDGIDTLEGGDGNDRLLYLETFTGSGNVDIFDGGAGDDIFVIQNLTFERIVDLAAGIFATGNINGAISTRGTLIDIENVIVSGDQDIRGDSNNNILTATAGAYTNAIHAGSGSDTVNGGDGNDTILGEGGADFLYGQGDDDSLDGGSSSDLVYGGAGNDTVLGGSGNDILAGDAGNDSLDGGAGTDLVDGGAGNDTLSGGTGDAFSDTLDGGDGDDLFLFGNASGVDNFIGGAGDDTVDYGSVAQSTTVDLLNGTWYFGITFQSTISDVENVIMGSGSDSVDGSAADNTIIANGGNDTVNGDAGSDTIDGGSGDDFITSGGGFDSLVGGDGNDTLLSETADDTLLGGAGEDLLNGGNNRDLLFGGDDDDKVFGGNGLDTLYGEQGNDTLVGGKAIDSDTLIGGDGDDILLGQEGEDELYGEDGNDRLSGGSQSDLMIGGAGNDTLLGGGGLDTMWGGTGDDEFTGAGQADLFVFEDNFGADTITDFAAGVGAEKINLTNVSAITDVGDLFANHLMEVGGDTIIFDGLGNTITLVGVSQASLIAADFDFNAPPPLPPAPPSPELPAPDAAGASASELMLAMQAIERPGDSAPDIGVASEPESDLSAGWVSLDDIGFDFA